MAKYVMLIYGSDEAWEAMPEDERKKRYAEIERWWGENARAGRIIGGEELAPRQTAKIVDRRSGTPVVTDGPFTETKETVGGYGLLEVPDMDAAVALAKSGPFRHVELRAVVESTG